MNVLQNCRRQLSSYKILSMNSPSYTFQDHDANASLIAFLVEGVLDHSPKVLLYDFLNTVQIRNRIFTIQTSHIFINCEDKFDASVITYEPFKASLLLKKPKAEQIVLEPDSVQHDEIKFTIPKATEDYKVQLQISLLDSKLRYFILFPPIQKSQHRVV